MKSVILLRTVNKESIEMDFFISTFLQSHNSMSSTQKKRVIAFMGQIHPNQLEAFIPK